MPSSQLISLVTAVGPLVGATALASWVGRLAVAREAVDVTTPLGDRLGRTRPV